MSGVAVLSQELCNDSVSLLVKHGDLMHFVIVPTEEDSQNVYVTVSNKIKISHRDCTYESFKYEVVVHLLLGHLQCRDRLFSVQLFSEPDDTEILEAFIFVLNLHFGATFSAESDRTSLTIKSGEVIVCQTFM